MTTKKKPSQAKKRTTKQTHNSTSAVSSRHTKKSAKSAHQTTKTNTKKSSNNHPIALSIPVHMIIAFVTLVTLFYIFFLGFSFDQPVTLLFGMIIRGSWAYVINVTFLLISLTLLVGLLRQKRFTFYVGLFWFTFSFADAAISLFLGKGMFITISPLFHKVLVTSLLLINALILWYFFERRDYFTALQQKQDRPQKSSSQEKRLAKWGLDFHMRKDDKLFVILLACVWVAFIVFFLIIGTRVYKEVLLTTVATMDELEDKFFWQSRDICLQRSGLERDVCYFVLATQIDNEDLIASLGVCELIESDLLKVACYKI